MGNGVTRSLIGAVTESRGVNGGQWEEEGSNGVQQGFGRVNGGDNGVRGVNGGSNRDRRAGRWLWGLMGVGNRGEMITGCRELNGGRKGQ